MRQLIAAIAVILFASISTAAKGDESTLPKFDERWSWTIGFHGIGNQWGVNALIQTPRLGKYTSLRLSLLHTYFDEYDPTYQSSSFSTPGSWVRRTYETAELDFVFWALAIDEKLQPYSTLGLAWINSDTFSNHGSLGMNASIGFQYPITRWHDGGNDAFFIEAGPAFAFELPKKQSSTPVYNGMLLRVGSRHYF